MSISSAASCTCASAPTATTPSASRSRMRASAPIPLGPWSSNTLREWKLACPKGDLGLVFPTARGRIEHHKNIVRALAPVLIAAGLTDKDGQAEVHGPARAAALLRVVVHQPEGGRRARTAAEVVQERLGHASIVMTLDRYGHSSRPRTTAPNWPRLSVRSSRHRNSEGEADD